MAYNKTNWTKETPINTYNLNKIEEGIDTNDKKLGNKQDKLTAGENITIKEDGTISASIEKAYFNWCDFKTLSIPANSQANLINARQITTAGKPLVIIVSVTAMVTRGNWSLFVLVDGKSQKRMLCHDNRAAQNYTNTYIITNLPKGTHTFEFKFSTDGDCTVPNYNQHSVTVFEI